MGKQVINQGRREIWIDVLRAFACACVLMVHSPAISDGQISGTYILAPANYVFMAWGVSVFFMISGALLFSKAQPLVGFYKKRFSRILIPTIIWSIIYIFFDGMFEESEKGYLNKILMIPFTQQTGLLWFMYTLVGIYLITPIISVWLSNCSKREVQVVLCLWGVTLLLPYFALLDDRSNEIIHPTGVLHHFYGFVGYALWGYYLRKYVNIPILSLKFIVLVILAFVLPVIIFITGWLPVDVLNTSMSATAALMSTIAFLFFKGLDYKDNKLMSVILKVSEFSFGIYLCHILFLKPLRYWLTQFHVNFIIQIPLTALFVGVVSFGFVALLSRIPRSKWLFG